MRPPTGRVRTVRSSERISLRGGVGGSPQQQRDTLLAWGDLSLLAVAIVWGSSYLAMKWTVDDVPVFEFLALRFALGALFLVLVYWRRVVSLTRGEMFLGLVFGTMLFCILSLETIGVQHTSAANAGVIIALSAVFVPVVEGALFRRRPRPSVVACAVVSVAGCALLSVQDGFRVQAGDAIILAAASVRALQMASFRWLTRGRKVDTAGVTVFELLVVTVLSVLALSVGQERVPLSELSGGHWAIIAYLGVLGTAFAFFVQLTVIRRTSAARAGIVLSSEPVFAAGFAIGVGGERLDMRQWIGSAVIVAAVLVGRAVATDRDSGDVAEREALPSPVPAAPIEA